MSTERDAISLLAEKGWIQGKMRTDEGVCLLGACFDVVGWHGNCLAIDRISPHLSEVIKEQFPDRITDDPYSHPAPAFNDHPDTVIEDVILVLEKAALRSEEQV